MTSIEVWAPCATRVDLDTTDDLIPMRKTDRPGWFHAALPSSADTYAFHLDGGPPRPQRPRRS